MSKPQVTEWFPASVKPVRVGVYEARFSGETLGYAYFNGKRWGWLGDSCREAMFKWMRTERGAAQDKEWRGLTAKAR